MLTVAITKMGRLNHPDPELRGRVEVIDFPEQDLGPHDVKIRVAYAGSSQKAVGDGAGFRTALVM